MQDLRGIGIVHVPNLCVLCLIIADLHVQTMCLILADLIGSVV